VEDQVVPSAKGWDEPETPSAASLAERFIQERRQSLGQTEDDDWPAAGRDEDGVEREL
jgi:hypothetical protein